MSGASNVRAGGAYVELNVRDNLSASLAKAKAQLEAFGKGAKELGSSVMDSGKAVLGFGAAIIGGLGAAAMTFAHIGSELKDMADRTGVSVEALSELQFVFAQTGVSAEDLETSFKKMSKFIVSAAEGSQGATDLITKLGLSLSDLASASPERQMEMIADAVAKIQNPSERAAVAIELFGRSGTKMLPVLQQGGDALRRMREEAGAMGLTVSTDAANAADVLDDSVGALFATLRKLAFEIGAAVAPMLTEFVNYVRGAVSAVTTWVMANQEFIRYAVGIGAAILGAGAAMVALGAVIYGVGSAISTVLAIGSGLYSFFSGLVTFMGAVGNAAIAMWGAILSPTAIVVGALAVVIGAFLYFSGTIDALVAQFSETFGAISGIVTETFAGIRDALASGDLVAAGQVAMAGLRALIQAAWTGILKLWYGAVYSLAEAWEVIASTAGEVFDRVVTTITNAFNDAVNFVAKKIVELSRFLGVDEIVLGVKVDDAMMQEMFRGMDRDTKALQAARNSELEARSQTRERELRDKIGALEAAYGQDTDAAQKELDAARRELQSIKDDQAKRRAEKADTVAKPAGVPEFAVPSIDTSGASKASEKLASRGGFNAAALAGLLSNEDIQSRIATSTRQTAENTRRLVESARNGGSSFV
jgi:hypothetical protein